jgi:hypothetical protein
MRADILASDVGNERTISVGIAIEDQGPLLTLIGRTKTLATKKQPELERHIEARQSRGDVQRDGGEIEAFSGGRRSDQTPGAPSTAKILYVDTSPDLLAYVSALLKRAGYEVFTSRYLGEALTLAKVIKPNVVICGAGVPELTTGRRRWRSSTRAGRESRFCICPPIFLPQRPASREWTC